MQLERNGKQMEQIKSQASSEKNVIGKTIVAVLAAGAISAFSVGAAYMLVTTLQPSAAQPSLTAEYCGDKDDGDKPKVFSATCGEEKDGGGKTVGA